ncbi:hypothetical protein [Paenibacillus sp. KS1]|uniref:hypothetical protein n=1 Tax=Paenibacillus sp. KS1 TaxID=1849249 RepID=UPI0011120437|nr:hypothetical protein [Paenibacillus sp. KS1]
MHSRLKKKPNRKIAWRTYTKHITHPEICGLLSKWLVRSLLWFVLCVVTAQSLLLVGAFRPWVSPVDRLEGVPFHPPFEEENLSFERGLQKR